MLESCTGGLVYSEDLQTCDWPRNVPCNKNNSVETNDKENINIAIESKKGRETSKAEFKLELKYYFVGWWVLGGGYWVMGFGWPDERKSIPTSTLVKFKLKWEFGNMHYY